MFTCHFPKWLGENLHQMINSIDPDDHSPRLHVVIAIQSFFMWLKKMWPMALACTKPSPGLNFSISLMWHLWLHSKRQKAATENALLFPFISVQGWVLYLYLPISSDFGFRYWGVKVRLFWGWISNRVNYLYDLDWTGSRLYF